MQLTVGALCLLQYFLHVIWNGLVMGDILAFLGLLGPRMCLFLLIVGVFGTWIQEDLVMVVPVGCFCSMNIL